MPAEAEASAGKSSFPLFMHDKRGKELFIACAKKKSPEARKWSYLIFVDNSLPGLK